MVSLTNYKNIIFILYFVASIRKFSRYFRLWPEYLLAFLVTLIYFYFTFFWHYDDNCPVGYIGKFHTQFYFLNIFLTLIY